MLTIAINCAVLSFSDVEKMRPAREVGEVKVEIVCFGQGIQIGRIEPENIHGMKMA